MDKTKTISPRLIADISVYFGIIPILIFLFFKYNWREKLKWVCALLILSNFSFDLIGSYYSKIPVASGKVIEATGNQSGSTAILKIESGHLYKRQFFWSGDFVGIVSNIKSDNKDGNKLSTVEISSNDLILSPNNTFRTYSTLKFENTLLLIELSLIFFIFHIIFKDNKVLSRLTLGAIALSAILWIYKNVVLSQIHQYGGAYNAGTAILVILFSLIYFYHQLNKPESYFIYSSPSFWIVVSILLYKAGTFFLFLFANTLNLEDLANFYLFDSIFYILQNLFFAIAFLVRAKEQSLNFKHQ